MFVKTWSLKNDYVCEIAFAGFGSWSFDNKFAHNVLIFGVNDGSWKCSGSRRNNFLMSAEIPTDDNVGEPKNKLRINFVKSKTGFFLSWY